MERDEGEGEPIDRALLEQWEPAHPPDGFAERVVDARGGASPRSGRALWRGVFVGTAIAAVAAMVFALALVWPSGQAVQGTIAAVERASVPLAERGIAVVEPGAELSWRIDADGEARIEQSAGAVFYRVDPGPAFEVDTPYGTVRVTGTCFTVEVIEMQSKTMKAMVAGAALSAAVVVTVYEGRVVLADDAGEVVVRPGQRASAGKSRAAGLVGDDDSVEANADATGGAARAQLGKQQRELERLRAEGAQSRDEIERLREQVESLGGDPGGPPRAELPEQRAQRCAKASRHEDGCSFVEPDQETLLEMARCGSIKIDVPSFLYHDTGPAGFDSGSAAAAGLSADERAALGEASEKFRDDYTDRLRRLYIDAGGNPDLAAELPAQGLRGVVMALFDAQELGDARRRIARERAGLEEPPAELSTADHVARTIADAGNDYERTVATVVGASRARELRLLDDGWPGGTSHYSGACEDD